MSEQFVKLPTDILKRRDLSGNDKVVFAVVMDHQRDNGFCWPGILSLMSSTGLARQTVISAIQRLESAGLVDVIRRGNGKSNHYKTGPTIRPVQRLDRSKDCTTGGLKIRPEPVQKLDPKQTDELKQRESAPPISKSFPKPPSPAEVREYAESIDYRAIDAEKFCAHYEAVGWRVNGYPVLDWRGLVVKWKLTERNRPSSPNGATNQAKPGLECEICGAHGVYFSHLKAARCSEHRFVEAAGVA